MDYVVHYLSPPTGAYVGDIFCTFSPTTSYSYNLLNRYNTDERKYQIIDQQIKSFVSVEKLHKSTPNNRHIFFAGIPLSHSLQLLSTLKREQLSRERAEKLESQVKKLTEEVDSLNEEKRVDFYRFECSVRKAVAVGMGVSRLVRFVK